MAGKAKSCYLTVTLKTTHKSVFHKMFFNAKAMNDYVKTEEFLALYPPDLYNYVKETY
jgi:hypothetical protein